MEDLARDNAHQQQHTTDSGTGNHADGHVTATAATATAAIGVIVTRGDVDTDDGYAWSRGYE